MINRVGLDYPDDSGPRAGPGGGRRDLHPRRGAHRRSRPGRRRGHGTGWRPDRAGATRAPGHERGHRGRLVVQGSARSRASDRSEHGPTGTRLRPAGCRDSLLVLGGGPTGVELAQVYARFGVPVTIVQSGPRLAPTDHPRNSEAALRALERDGVTVRLGVRAMRAHAALGARGADVIELDDGYGRRRSRHAAGGRADVPARWAGPRVGRPRLGRPAPRRTPAHRRWAVADRRSRRAGAAHPPGHYQGEMAVRMARGEPISPDYRALPRATYIEPELAFVGLTLEGALAADIDAFEQVADFATSTKGYSVEADVRARDDRRGPRDTPAGRCRDGRAGRLRGHPRMRPGDQGTRADRRPGRDHPRLPIDLADPERPLRRCRARAPG